MKLNFNKIITPLLLSSTVYAQNLVVNSTFECKHVRTGYGELVKVHGWENANTGTADLFDKNRSKWMRSPNGIPNNYMGSQLAGNGQNYAGIVAYYDDGDNSDRLLASGNNNFVPRKKDGYKRYTEYVEGAFRDGMIAGMVYHLSFKVSLAERSGRAVSCLGALISKEKIKQDNNTFLEQVPQFISHRVISDTAGWITLSGSYIASGGEKFITIGCFKDENFLVENMASPLSNDSRKAYYYISEVSVEPYSESPKDLEPIVHGVDYVELMDVQFASGSSEITSQLYSELDHVAQWMTKYPAYKFFIAGYTDQQGQDDVNDALSFERAANVKKYLADKGVNAGNILTGGFGSVNPLENKVRSRKNRRVEIYLYSTGK